MRESILTRQSGALAFVAIAACYAALLGRHAYPFSLPVFLLAVIAAARVFGWLASATALGASCVIVTYFVIPPMFSFRMEGKELWWFSGYTLSALLAGATISVWRKPWIATSGLGEEDGAAEPANPEAKAEEKARFALTCTAEGSLVELSLECRRYTGASPAHYAGFRWLELVHRNDRNRVVDVIGLQKQPEKPVLCRFRRADGQYRWFEIVAEPGSWTATEQSQPVARRVTDQVVLTAVEVDTD